MADPARTDVTPEQVEQARDLARRRLAEARARCTPEFWARVRAKYGIRPAA